MGTRPKDRDEPCDWKEKGGRYLHRIGRGSVIRKGKLHFCEIAPSLETTTGGEGVAMYGGDAQHSDRELYHGTSAQDMIAKKRKKGLLLWEGVRERGIYTLAGKKKEATTRLVVKRWNPRGGRKKRNDNHNLKGGNTTKSELRELSE